METGGASSLERVLVVTLTQSRLLAHLLSLWPQVLVSFQEFSGSAAAQHEVHPSPSSPTVRCTPRRSEAERPQNCLWPARELHKRGLFQLEREDLLSAFNKVLVKFLWDFASNIAAALLLSGLSVMTGDVFCVEKVSVMWKEAVWGEFGAADDALLWLQRDWRCLLEFSGLLRCGSDAQPVLRNPKRSPTQNHQQAEPLGGGGFTPHSDPAVWTLQSCCCPSAWRSCVLCVHRWPSACHGCAWVIF